MDSPDLSCWKCGANLADVLLPFSRLAKCKACNADLHVCRMCRFHDTTVSNSCTEPLAEKVVDKTRKNFCGYFQPDPGAWKPATDTPAAEARKQLEDIFGLAGKPAASPGAGQEDDARKKLDDLFGLNKDK